MYADNDNDQKLFAHQIEALPAPYWSAAAAAAAAMPPKRLPRVQAIWKRWAPTAAGWRTIPAVV